MVSYAQFFSIQPTFPLFLIQYTFFSLVNAQRWLNCLFVTHTSVILYSCLVQVKKKTSKKSFKPKNPPNPLFPNKPRNFRIGQDILPKKRDLGRYVRWPRYIRIQRQRKILYQRLKVPPSINQFTHVLDKNQATEIFKLFNKYRPETRHEKKDRLKKIAEQAVKGDGSIKKEKPPPCIKYGLKHITSLIEKKEAKLVLIANDVDPIELVLWLPALCR